MKEKAGKIEEAALMLQDVQVETFGAMEREEKTKYILKQMVLLLRRSDYIRCQIVSKKLSTKLLEAADLQPLKCLEFFAIFMVLAPYDAEAKDLIAKTLKEEIKKVQQLPTFE
ncbi:26S proteasome non-ATPase regulatory subunit, putative [Eimeria mitis]|uniref:26S proteasome non-ATPase regulatory subunit, putative n=1 Tax=Eimeria mitis TaxID=44415 RepID=U6KGP8_9EIME|nr:26S proteasome non-ATPase regulatory subunit, putative [Eimeria mitis]CDJ34638.1 26S proteasome non-ATPase regulatory subunit, putative [Eimeria mitis]